MEVSTGYKQTELGVIPEEWDVKPLKEISPRQSVGLVINPSTYFDNVGAVPMLVGSDVGENKINWQTAKRITAASNQKLPASRLCAADLVMVRVGEPGTTAVIPQEYDGCNCASMMIIRRHPSFDSDWLCFAMNSPLGRTRITDVQYGTAQKQFNISDAVDFLYPVPPLLEQRAIAVALSDVDALLGGLDRLLAKKRDLKQAAMQQLLTGQTRLPGFSGEWKVRPLASAVASLDAGVSVNSVEHGKPLRSGEPCILKTSAIFDGCFDPEECKLIDRRDIIRAKLSPRRDTIIISRMNTPNLVGEVGYVPDDFPTLNLPDRLWMTRFDPNSDVCARWLAYVMSSPQVKENIKGLATGTSGSMKNIGKGKLLALQLEFPAGKEQPPSPPSSPAWMSNSQNWWHGAIRRATSSRP